jgi:protein ImuB
MCVLLPQWPIDCQKRRQRRPKAPEQPSRPPGSKPAPPKGEAPLVLVRTVATRQLVVVASQEAQVLGIRPGLTLAQARALCAHVQHAPYRPDLDQRALQALGRWMMRFTPIVSCADSGEPDEPVPAGLLLDVGGCQRLFGGLDKLQEHIRQAMARLGLSFRLALAGTAAAAWALAYGNCPTSGSALSREHLGTLLAPLPVEALRLDEATIQTLHDVGVVSIGQLMVLPRESLPARFGPRLTMRLDQALGRTPEPLTPLQVQSPVKASMDFQEVVDSTAALEAVFERLLAEVLEQLERRGCGARQLEVQLLRPVGPPIHRSIRLSRPSRHAGHLKRLFGCALEDMVRGLQERGESQNT